MYALETVLDKKKVSQRKPFTSNDFYQEIDIDTTLDKNTYPKQSTSIKQPISLKDDWMQFMEKTLTEMYRKISF